MSRIVMAIDPGHTESAYVVWNGKNLMHFGKHPNDEMASLLSAARAMDNCLLAIERIQSMGMSVGEEIFETCRWEARFAMLWEDDSWSAKRHLLVPRMRVKMHHCHDSRAKDANIRQALIDRFGPGKEKAIGTKKKPGPLLGISGDVWSALAIATAVHDVGEKWEWDLNAIREHWLLPKAA